MPKPPRLLQAKEAIALRIKLQEQIEEARSTARQLNDGMVDYLLGQALDALQVTSLSADLDDLPPEGRA